ncbi:MAG: cell division protein FtsH, partial [Actinomycetota bacterium]|nr:cell division protein FtsH [Actinomycetota bacterium]
RVIDEEVARILRSQQDRARQALLEHRGALDRVAEALLDRETISGGEVVELIPEPTDDRLDPPAAGEPVVQTPPS